MSDVVLLEGKEVWLRVANKVCGSRRQGVALGARWVFGSCVMGPNAWLCARIEDFGMEGAVKIAPLSTVRTVSYFLAFVVRVEIRRRILCKTSEEPDPQLSRNIRQPLDFTPKTDPPSAICRRVDASRVET